MHTLYLQALCLHFHLFHLKKKYVAVVSESLLGTLGNVSQIDNFRLGENYTKG